MGKLCNMSVRRSVRPWYGLLHTMEECVTDLRMASSGTWTILVFRRILCDRLTRKSEIDQLIDPRIHQ